MAASARPLLHLAFCGEVVEPVQPLDGRSPRQERSPRPDGELLAGDLKDARRMA